jgi:hypothetical protein
MNAIPIPPPLLPSLKEAAYNLVQSAAEDIVSTAQRPGRTIGDMGKPVALLTRQLALLRDLEQAPQEIDGSHLRAIVAAMQTARETQVDLLTQGIRSNPQGGWAAQERLLEELRLFGRRLSREHYTDVAREAGGEQ